jgi:hypothetical protein
VQKLIAGIEQQGGNAAMMITVITTIMAAAMVMLTVPKIYTSFIDAKLLYLEEELELLRELQSERNDCMLRHLFCGLGTVFLVWIVKGAPELEVPNQMAPAMAVYATASLFFALLESLLAHKIEAWIAAAPPRVGVQNQR